MSAGVVSPRRVPPSISNRVMSGLSGRRNAPNHHERAVVGERLSLRVLLELPQQGLFDLRGHLPDLSAEKLLQARKAELGAVGAVRLGDSVGVQTEEVSGGEREAGGPVWPSGKEGERQPVRRELLHRPVALQEDTRVVAGVRVLDLAGRGIEKNEKERDEAIGAGAPRDRFRKSSR